MTSFEVEFMTVGFSRVLVARAKIINSALAMFNFVPPYFLIKKQRN
jgi:hypothetical protein